MKTNHMKRLALMAAVLLLTVLVGTSALAENYSASTMRLLRYAGSVEIFDASGNSRFVLENVRFGSGESMRTGEDGYASVSLDASKIVTLDASSRVQFIQSANHMELLLTEGTLFLDVSEKLDENETLDIKTSTMTVGIRGTVVYLSVLPANEAEALMPHEQTALANGSGKVTLFGVLEGSAAIRYNSAGSEQTMTVSAGQAAVLPDNELSGSAPAVLTDLTRDQLSSFVQEQIENESVLARVKEACPQLFEEYPYTVDGNWEFDGKVTIIAQSASKLYDGTPLTRTGDILVYGLPDEFGISAYAGGARTDAGVSENPVASYTITNKYGDDITAHFPDIETVSGQLVVDPAPMTIWTGSASKPYDGSPLTCAEAGFDLISGNHRYDTPWSNTSLVLSEAEGETLYGLSGTILVHGTNPLTEETREDVLSVGYKMTVHLSDSADQDSIAFVIEKVREDELPEEVLRVYAANPELLQKACEEAGWDEKVIRQRIAALSPAREQTAMKDGLTVPVSMAGGLRRQITNARINIDSGITDYNGRALSGEEATFAEIRIDDDVKVTATGSQTEVGQSQNSYEITWGTVNPQNFAISEDLGVLEVTEPRPALALYAASASKVYDGTPLTANSVSVYNLPNGLRYFAIASGSQTNAGTSANVPGDFWIFDDSGNDLTDSFTEIRRLNGTLTVEPLQLRLDLGCGAVSYAGFASLPSPTITYLNGSHAGETATAARMRSISAVYRFMLFTGDTVTVTVSGMDAGVGQHTLTAEVSYSDGAQGSCVVSSVTGNTVTVTPAALSITTSSASKHYDGTALVSPEVTVEGLQGDDQITVTATGSQTELGESPNTYTIDWGTVDKNNYTISETLGTLTVDGFVDPVYLYAPGISRPYDGTPLVGDEATSEGLPEGYSVVAEFSGSQTEVGETECFITSYQILNADGEDVTESFLNVSTEPGSLTVTPAPLTIATESATKPYDGLPLTAPASVSGLADGETVTVTATGEITIVGEVTNKYTIDWGSTDQENYAVSESLGTLTVTVNPTPITITAHSAQKVYDGTVLMDDGCDVEGLPNDELWAYGFAQGSQTDAGSSENKPTEYMIGDSEENDVSAYFSNVTLVNGTLTVTPVEVQIQILDTTLPFDNGYHRADYQINCDREVTVSSDFSPSVRIDEIMFQMQFSPINVKNAGSWDATCNVIWAYGNQDNYNVTVTDGTLTITPVPLTVTTGSASRAFNNEQLTNDEASITGFTCGEGVTVTATGSITSVGSIPNSYSINWMGWEPTNYAITENLGTLTVTKQTIYISVAGTDSMFDGTLKLPDEITITDADGASYTPTISATDSEITATVSLPGGVSLQVACGGFTNAGTYTYAPTCTLSAGGEDSYEIEIIPSSVTISPLTVVLSASCESPVTYNGEYQGASSLTVLAGPTPTEPPAHIDYSDANAGTIYWDWGDKTAVSLTGGGTNASDTPYDISCTYSMLSGSASNYSFFVSGAQLKIDPAPLTLHTASNTWGYDGTAHHEWGVSYDGLMPADSMLQYSTYTDPDITDVGSVTNTATIYWDGREQNYTLTEDLGTVTVTPAAATIKTSSSTKNYDGTPLTSTSASIEGLVGSETATVTGTGSITNAGETPNTYTIEWGTAKADNYAITEVLGKLTVLPAQIILSSTAGDSVDYNGLSYGLDGGCDVQRPMLVQYNGDTYDATAFGSWSGSTYTAVLPTGDTLQAVISGSGAEPGTVTYAISSYSISPSSSAGNYSVSGSFGDLEIRSIFDTQIFISATSDGGYSVEGWPSVTGITLSDVNVEIDDDYIYRVTSYTITNAKGEDITSRFTNITLFASDD